MSEGSPEWLDGCTCDALRRAARHLTQVYDKGLAPAGLRTSQYSLLGRLARNGPHGIQSLARDMGVDRTTLGRNLLPLERDGLVSVQVDARDRRGRALQITERGRERLAQAALLWEATQARFTETYGADRSRSLHAALDELATVELP